MRKPTFMTRLKMAIDYFRSGRSPVRSQYWGSGIEGKQFPMLYPDYREGTPQWHIVNYDSYVEEGFDANSLIYSAIMYKARSAGLVKLRAYSGDVDNPEPLSPDRPLSQLVARPNPSTSWREFQILQTVYFNLDGNAYTYYQRPRGGGLPVAMYALRPDRTFIVPGRDASRDIRGYLYVPEGKQARDGIPMLAQDVSHVKLPNPGDELDGFGYGLSPVAPMSRSADVDNMVTNFIKLFFERGAIVPGILRFETAMKDEVVDEIKRRWAETYGGYENWDEVGVLDRGGSYERIGMGFDEMGFETQDERNESRILGPLGVPPILIGTRIGLKRSTYENWEHARRAFWEDVQIPEILLFEDDYKYYLQDRDGKEWVAFDFSDVPALQVNKPEMVVAFTQLVSYGVPKHRAASLLNLDIGDLPDGDTIYMISTLVPMGKAGDGTEDGEVEEGDMEESTDEAGGADEGVPEPEAEEESEDLGKGWWQEGKGDEYGNWSYPDISQEGISGTSGLIDGILEGGEDRKKD